MRHLSPEDFPSNCSPALQCRVTAVALDVDGTLTDGAFYWSVSGEEMKRFHFLDVMGIARALRLGIQIALISGEDSPLVDRFAKKLGIEWVRKGCKDKESALRDFSAESGIALELIAFMGDDINDVPAMRIAGLAAAPVTAHNAAVAAAEFISERPAGSGAVRDLIDYLWGEKINV